MYREGKGGSCPPPELVWGRDKIYPQEEGEGFKGGIGVLWGNEKGG